MFPACAWKRQWLFSRFSPATTSTTLQLQPYSLSSSTKSCIIIFIFRIFPVNVFLYTAGTRVKMFYVYRHKQWFPCSTQYTEKGKNRDKNGNVKNTECIAEWLFYFRFCFPFLLSFISFHRVCIPYCIGVAMVYIVGTRYSASATHSDPEKAYS